MASVNTLDEHGHCAINNTQSEMPISSLDNDLLTKAERAVSTSCLVKQQVIELDVDKTTTRWKSLDCIETSSGGKRKGTDLVGNDSKTYRLSL